MIEVSTLTNRLVALVPVAAVVAVLAGAAFVWWERRDTAPMVPPSLWASRTFTVANLLTFVVSAALSGLFFFLVLLMVWVLVRSLVLLRRGGALRVLGTERGARLTELQRVVKARLARGPVRPAPGVHGRRRRARGGLGARWSGAGLDPADRRPAGAGDVRRAADPSSLALLQASIRREDRSAASGRWAGLTSVAVIAGPLGGGLVELTSWRADRGSPRGLSSAQALSSRALSAHPLGSGSAKPAGRPTAPAPHLTAHHITTKGSHGSGTASPPISRDEAN